MEKNTQSVCLTLRCGIPSVKKLMVLDIIEVKRNGGDQIPAAEWVVARRYSEFFQLHQELRAKFNSVKHLEFPRRRVVMKLQKDFLDKRRLALENYLKVIHSRVNSIAGLALTRVLDIVPPHNSGCL